MNEEETTKLIPDWGGNYITYSWCENCGMPVVYPTDWPYNACPYCRLRVIYEKEEKK